MTIRPDYALKRGGLLRLTPSVAHASFHGLNGLILAPDWNVFSWYDRLGLKAKLATGLTILIGLALVVGASSVVTGELSRSAIDRMFGQDGQIAQLSLRSVGAMLKARRYEKDFLLNYRDIGYEMADTRYAALVRVNLAQVREDLGRIRTLTSDPKIIEQVQAIEGPIAQYERNFMTATELIGKIGNSNTGLETELGERYREIEKILAARGRDKLTIDLLTLRGYEKDYLLLGRAVDAIRFRDKMVALRENVAQAAALPSAVKDRLFVLVEEYGRLFEAYVEAMTKIDSAQAYFLTALQVVEPALEKLNSQASQNALATRARVNNLTQLATILAIVISVAAVFIGLMVAIVISRSITRSIRNSMQFAENVARGDFDTRLTHYGQDEFGALAVALNGMTDALQEARRAQEQRSGELAEANRALQSEIVERQRAELAISQLNVDLEQGVAQRTAQLETANHELSERNREISLLSEMSRVLQSCVNLEEAYEAIPGFCLRLFPHTSGAIYMLHASRNYLQAVLFWGDDAPGMSLFSPQECWALRRSQPHWIGGPGADLVCQHVREAGQADAPCYCVPMMAQGDTLGLVHIKFPPGQDASQEAVKLAAARQTLGVMLSEQLELGLANLTLRETLRQQSIRDPLTGLYNRRYLEESMQRELARAERKAAPLALIMLDVDQFKQFNDNFGHEAGDLVLREIGLLLRGHVRGGDIACRYGGEEFTVLMPETALEIAQQRAERLREAVRRLQLNQSGQMLGGITISLGVALYPEHGDSPEKLLRAADVALYEAKRAGRDQVAVAESV